MARRACRAGTRSRASREVVPPAVLLVSEEARAGRREMPLHEPRQLGIGHHLPLRHAALPDELEFGNAALHADMPLAQRRDAEGPILLVIAFPTNPEEALADEAHHRGGDGATRGSS